MASNASIARWRSSGSLKDALSYQGVFKRIYEILIQSEGIREEQVVGWLE